MSKQCIATQNAPAAIGPYSQAVSTGNSLFVSGQLPADLSGNLLSDIREATKCCLTNIKTIAEASGFSMSDAVKLSIFMTDLNDFAAMNEAYAAFFPENPPARFCVQVAALPKGAVIEIDAVLAK